MQLVGHDGLYVHLLLSFHRPGCTRNKTLSTGTLVNAIPIIEKPVSETKTSSLPIPQSRLRPVDAIVPLKLGIPNKSLEQFVDNDDLQSTEAQKFAELVTVRNDFNSRCGIAGSRLREVQERKVTTAQRASAKTASRGTGTSTSSNKKAKTN
jgi:hypothetical protein